MMRSGVAALLRIDVDARFHDADEMDPGSLELRGELAARAVGKLLSVPAKLPVLILSPCLPVEIELEGIERNVLGAVGLHVLQQLLLVDPPLAVDEAQGPFGKERSMAAQIRDGGED